MLNKDKDIYLQESIEDGQYLMLSQPPEIQVKVFISWSDLWSRKFQFSPSGDFQKNIPTCSSFTSNFQFSPHWSHSHPLISSNSAEEFIISRTKYSALVTQNLDTIYSLTLFHSNPHLTSLEAYQMKTTGCSPSSLSCQKLLSLVCVTFLPRTICLTLINQAGTRPLQLKCLL